MSYNKNLERWGSGGNLRLKRGSFSPTKKTNLRHIYLFGAAAGEEEVVVVQ